MNKDVEELENRYPAIEWRKPLIIKVLGRGDALGCRFCLALKGIRGEDVYKQPQTEHEFAEHMLKEHGIGDPPS